MTNPQTPVMFEFEGEDSKITTWNANEAVELFRNKHGLYLSIKAYDGPFIRLTKCHTARRFYHAQRDAQRDAQGWLSPEDQKPFCMESAMELGYDFRFYNYFVVNTKNTTYMAKIKETEFWGEVSQSFWVYSPKQGGELYFSEVVSFIPYNNPHETARLRELGVKRYQKAGE
jgi:hypothetical protein